MEEHLCVGDEEVCCTALFREHGVGCGELKESWSARCARGGGRGDNTTGGAVATGGGGWSLLDSTRGGGGDADGRGRGFVGHLASGEGGSVSVGEGSALIHCREGAACESGRVGKKLR